MSPLSLDQQTVPRTCDNCQSTYPVVRGSVFSNGRPIGLYLTALHGGTEEQPAAHLAIAVLDEKERRVYAAALLLKANTDDFLFTFEDWEKSPFRDEAYLGVMLDRGKALQSERKGLFLQIAEYVAISLPQVNEYLTT